MEAKERRKFMRFDAFLIVLYELLGGKPLKAKSRLKDVSKEGLRLSLENGLPKGSILELEMTPPGQYVPIIAFGEVVWSRKTKGGYFYDVGLRLTKIKPQDKARLLDYAYEEWRKVKRNLLELVPAGV